MLEVVIHKEKEFRRALDRHYVDGDSIVFGVGDNVNLIMGRLSVLFALCINRVAFQNSVFVERHMSLPRWKENGRRSRSLLWRSPKGATWYSCYEPWQDSRRDASSTAAEVAVPPSSAVSGMISRSFARKIIFRLASPWTP